MADIILSVIVEAAKCLAPPIYRQMSYLRKSKYTSNLQNLKTEVGNLEAERVSKQREVDEAKRRGEEIEKYVEKWLASVNGVIDEAEKFTGVDARANKRCFKGLCPNLKIRRRLSKEAERQKEAIVKVREAGRFDRISYNIIPDDSLLLSNKDYEAFESRMSTLNGILDALKNPDVNMLGIYGMGGIGKTTLAKEVARKAENEKLFDQVIFVEVSQIQDIRKIQGEFADKLGLTLHEETESGRARSLCNRLKKEKRILVILDNIWENLDFQAVGIPHGDGHKGSKVLLTARSLDVLSRKMDSQQNFSFGVLKEDEAWSLFKKMAGDYIEGSEFKWVAREVAKECAGLPVSIVTVARALRNKRLFEWKDALEQLRRPSSTNFKDIQPTAYKAIELSYVKLEGDELKNIFLLIGYTAIASIDDLLMFGMGLGLFQGIKRMEAARARVQTLVHKLKASCMLLDDMTSGNEDYFSMHDVVRDVAISIASRELNVFTAVDDVVDREWSEASAMKLYTSIVLPDVKTNVLPEVLECPQLKLFHIRVDRESSTLAISDNFFSRMTQVRVIDLTCMNLLSLPSSLGLLTNLQTLCLYYCKLQDTSVVGDLKNLEILCLRGCDITQLAVQVGQLTQLKLLDLRNCFFLKVIPPNVLSKLSRLEELYIGGDSFNKWEVEVVDGVKNASLDELKHLPNLTSLELQIKDVDTLPRGLFFKKLERFRIHIGGWLWRAVQKSCREFRLKLNTKICLKDGLIVQLQGIEDLELSGLLEQDVNYLVNELAKAGSSQLKHLSVLGLRAPAPNPTESERHKELTNNMRLNGIIVEDNINISKALFLEKVALPKLETLYLSSINIERIWQNQVAAMSCALSDSNALRYIRDLRKLTSFCTGDLHIEFPFLKELQILRCPEFLFNNKRAAHELTKKMFPTLEGLRVDAKHMATICQLPEDFICKLKCLEIMFDGSTTTSSLDFLQRFHTIKILHIAGGQYSVAYSVFEKVENGMKAIISEVNKCYRLKHILKQDPSSIMENLEWLEVIQFDNLANLVPSLTSFRNLTTLMLWRCKGLRNVLTSSTAKTLVRLRRMSIGSCHRVAEIVADDDEGDKDNAAAANDEIVFSELKELELRSLNDLTSFYSGINYAFKFPSLDVLTVSFCPNMRIFSGGELSTPVLRKVLHEDFVRDCWDIKERWIWEHDLNTTIQMLYLQNKSFQRGCLPLTYLGVPIFKGCPVLNVLICRPYLTKLDRSLIVAKESYYPLQGGRVDFAASDAFFVL
ncbi:AAA domain-containing protein [Citrus sinensis]|uniref:AAA domain-containing protein n=1 Tax=Citrus sinensis TaxID=2711 RepID=A0ACB8KIN9_CITSI|nr:AAA domain-containing protein [Citrus sinensis]